MMEDEKGRPGNEEDMWKESIGKSLNFYLSFVIKSTYFVTTDVIVIPLLWEGSGTTIPQGRFKGLGFYQ